MAIPGSHRRYNPLLDEWVLCSPQRLERPWQGQLERPAEESLPRHDPGCYLCPGNARANGRRNPDYAGTYAFDNDFPALNPEAPERLEGDGLLVARSERGRCRVLCFSPRHDLSLAQLSPAQVRLVVDAWAEETEQLGAAPATRYVQVFENKGALMGCSNPHPHGQLWAVEHVPSQPLRKVMSQSRYHRAHGSDLLGDYLERELREKERLVCANEHWVALVPFWAVWPFETLLLPRRRVPELPQLGGDERDALAEIVAGLNVRYDNLFRCSFPYSMGWSGRPLDGDEHAGWRLHASFVPPLLRSATIRKFLVGYELAAEPQRDLTAEQAALQLRSQPARHYLEDEAPGGPPSHGGSR